MVETTGDRMMTMRTTDKPFKITKKQVYEAYFSSIGTLV
jgi:hypothetical protein